MQTFRKLESAGKVNQCGIRQNLRLRASAPKVRTNRLSVARFNNNLHGARDSAPVHQATCHMLRIRIPKSGKKQHRATYRPVKIKKGKRTGKAPCADQLGIH